MLGPGWGAWMDGAQLVSLGFWALETGGNKMALLAAIQTLPSSHSSEPFLRGQAGSPELHRFGLGRDLARAGGDQRGAEDSGG